MLKLLLRCYGAIHALIALLFALVAVTLIVIGTWTGWQAVRDGLGAEAGARLIDTIGLLAVAVVALQVSQTITEEEVVREAHVSSPTRVRRFLSRFMVVIVVALTVEALVATMKALHENMSWLPYAAWALAGTGALLGAWGLFVWLNASAEKLEPEAMQQAKGEDRKFE
jgi:hypothetical protein